MTKNKNSKNKQRVMFAKKVVAKKLKGKGGYKEVLGAIPRAVGGAWGLMNSGFDGAKRGWEKGAELSKILGLGAYSVQRNSLVSTADSVPFMHSTDASIRIRHREFLTDILGSSSFSNRSYLLNPGDTGTFPWLSQLARNFQQYRFEGMVFYYRATSAFTNPSGGSVALGTVVMSTNYNVNDDPFVDKPTMEANMWTVSGRPCSDMTHPIECAPRQTTITELYVRRGSTYPSGVDKHFYDYGRFQLATVGMADSAILGELWVSYDVVLLKPIRPAIDSTVPLISHWTGGAVTRTVSTPFLTVTERKNTLALSLITNNTISVPVGGPRAFMVDVTGFFASGTVGSLKDGVALVNCAVISGTTYGFFDGAGSSNSPVSGATATTQSARWAVAVTDTAQIATFSVLETTLAFNLGVDITVYPLEPLASYAAVPWRAPVVVEPSVEDEEEEKLDYPSSVVLPPSSSSSAAAGSASLRAGRVPPSFRT